MVTAKRLLRKLVLVPDITQICHGIVMVPLPILLVLSHRAVHLPLTRDIEVRDEGIDGKMAAPNVLRDVVLEEELLDHGGLDPRFHALFNLFQESEMVWRGEAIRRVNKGRVTQMRQTHSMLCCMSS